VVQAFFVKMMGYCKWDKMGEKLLLDEHPMLTSTRKNLKAVGLDPGLRRSIRALARSNRHSAGGDEGWTMVSKCLLGMYLQGRACVDAS
jgi:hypothetical protein